MEIVYLILALALFVGIIVWAVRYTKKINNRKNEYFKALAQKHNMELTTSKWAITLLHNLQGTYKDCPFTIYEKVEGSGKNKTVVTYAKIDNVGFDFDFKLGKEHFFSKAGKVLGMKDIEFGDAEFDKKFLIKSKDEDQFRAFFNYKLQDGLKNIKDDLGASIRCQNGSLTYYYYGPLPNEKLFTRYERVLDFMFSMVDEKKR